ncbi:MAG: MFS transporter [Methanobacterium sp. ERen5]|nr:MAG: MFS transporter [Methanobacterium sp. ERen5]
MDPFDNNNKVKKTYILLIVTITSFLTPFIGSSLNIALPTIANELSVNAILLSWITTSFFLTSAMFALPIGRIADIYGMKKVFKYGIIILTLACFLSAIAPNADFLIISRVIQGIGSAMIFVTGLAIIISVFPSNERGKAIGINVTTVYLGLVIGPVLGGFLTQYFGWRSIFYLMIIMGSMLTILVLWKMNEIEADEICEEKIDYLGSLLYMLMLALILIGFSNINGTLGKLMIIFGILSLIFFIIWELRVETPVFEIKMFMSNKPFVLSNFTIILNYMGILSIGFLLSLYLQYIKGYNPNITGLILAVQTVVMVLISPIAGKLSDRFDPGRLALFGTMLITVGLFIFALVEMETSVYLIIGGLVFVGVGIGLFSAPNTHLIMSSVEKRYFGLASASASTMRLLGQTFGMGFTILIFEVYLGKIQFNPQNYPELLISTKVAFILFTILSVAAILISILRDILNKTSKQGV